MDLHTLWSVKGGVGVTVCAAVLAASAHDDSTPVTVIDIAGDQPAVLGLADPGDAPGLMDWLDGPDHPDDALDRLLIEARPGLEVLPRGGATLQDRERAAQRAAELLEWLRRRAGVVVVDAGRSFTRGVHPAHDAVIEVLLGDGSSWLVTRACFLALRRCVRVAAPADGVVLVEEPGRSLDRRDIASVLGRPVVTTVETDPGLARVVDSGSLLRRHPRTVSRALRQLL